MTAPRRAGFTLIELLIVIAIILVLLSLTATAYFKMQAIAPQRTTETAILKLYGSLEQQWNAAQDAIRAEKRDPALWNTALTKCGNDPGLALNEYVKQRLLQEFPTSPGAAKPGLPAFFKLNQAFPPQSSLGNPTTSGVCLYYALSVSHGYPTIEQSLSLKEKTDLGGGVMCLVDGWGEPLQFEIVEDAAKPGKPLKFTIRSAGPNHRLDDPNDPSSDDISSDKLRVGK
jgi:prepilin-type N-terminal cleavage/methylation domain-containing protein